MPEGQTFISKTSAVKLPIRSASLGWLSTLSLIFFMLSLLLSFGLFFYRGLLENQIGALEANLKKVESEFEPALILELQRTAKSINSAKDLLNKHPAPSQLLKFLEANTIADVRFFNFSYDKDGVDMSGTARSYTALAQQSLIFEQSRLISGVSFSNFSLTPEGFVGFNLEFKPQPELISYKISAK